MDAPERPDVADGLPRPGLTVDAPERPDVAGRAGTDAPWAGVGAVVVVLVTVAFASGWHLGRKWGRLMGW